MKKAIILCRVSSKEQEETGYSLEAQEKLLKEYSLKKKLDIIKIFKISESASGKQTRKLFHEMFSYTNKNKVVSICCEKIDRLTRNLKDADVVNEWIQVDGEREVHFVKENFVLNKNTKAHENFVWDMKVAIARFYTNNLSEEVKKGQKEKLAQGWLPTKPPLGYKTTGEKGHKTHYIDQEKAPFIKKMFELYSSGNYSTKALTAVMFTEGMRNPRPGLEPGTLPLRFISCFQKYGLYHLQ
jgi:site-specific DNA recombinase